MRQQPQEADEGARLEAALDAIERACTPASIFLYGSRARTDATVHSDHEIGVLLTEDRYVGRSVLRAAVSEPGMSVYPFRLEQFLEGKPDTPFNKKIYMRELIVTGKTLRGERVIESMEPPSIEVLEAISDAEFNLGRALAATMAHRDGAAPTANVLFYKSCLFGARCLVMGERGEFPPTYDRIVAASSGVELGVYADVVRAAYESRREHTYDPAMLFKNISYLNQLVIPTLRERMAREGNVVIVR